MNHLHTLRELYANHDGYVSDKWSLYLSDYERIFSTYRTEPVKLLEIGVQNGGSLELWRKYFPRSRRIIGCDINTACAKLTHDKDVIKVIVGDITTTETIKSILEDTPTFDIIIDDGSHKSNDIIQTFCKLFTHLQPGGVYVVEDLHCSYWKQYQGGLSRSDSSMAFFQALTDILNFEHWGLDHSRVEFLQRFDLSPELTETVLALLHSVEFVNSMCILTKKSSAQNLLGKRVVTGVEEPVYPVKRLDKTLLKVPSQVTKSEDYSTNANDHLCSTAKQKSQIDTYIKKISDQNKRIDELMSAQTNLEMHLTNAENQLALLKLILKEDA